MNVMKRGPKVIELVMQEHNSLREKLGQIHSVLSQPEPAQNEIELLLREFLHTLLVHFSNEEDAEGFFHEVTARAPQLTDQAGELCIEHKQLLHEADELCRFAAAGSPSMPWWRELNSRCHDFTKRLMRHEHDENKLLQEAHQIDGTYAN